jgi:hemerythrin-like domain-containing protein
MAPNPDPIKTLVDGHIGLLDNMYLLRTITDHLLKTFSPHLVEGLKRESMTFLKTMELHMRCEEEFFFPILKRALGGRSAPIISMLGEHSDMRENIERLRKIMSNVESADADKCIKTIKLADEEIDSLIDLFSRHIDKEEKCLFKLAREVLQEKELEEIEEKIKETAWGRSG